MDDMEKKIIDHVQAAYPRMVLTPSGVRAVLEAISASGTHVIVPVKPTINMIVNAENTQASRWMAKQDGRQVPHKEHEVLIWQAMLAARPGEK